MVRTRAMRTIENACRRLGFVRVAGVDEVGRGCLAGPVVAGAVVLDPTCHIAGLSDSKQVPAPERDRLYDQMAAKMPNFAEYQKNTTRRIPVVILERLGG